MSATTATTTANNNSRREEAVAAPVTNTTTVTTVAAAAVVEAAAAAVEIRTLRRAVADSSKPQARGQEAEQLRQHRIDTALLKDVLNLLTRPSQRPRTTKLAAFMRRHVLMTIQLLIC